ncbi:hypothetical protein BLAT2472_80244 [Burkholderia latens]
MSDHRRGAGGPFRCGIAALRGHGRCVRSAPRAHRGGRAAAVVRDARAMRDAAQRLRALLRGELALNRTTGSDRAGAEYRRPCRIGTPMQRAADTRRPRPSVASSFATGVTQSLR